MPYNPCLCTHAVVYPGADVYCDLTDFPMARLADRSKNIDCKFINPGMPKIKKLEEILRENRESLDTKPKRTRRKK